MAAPFKCRILFFCIVLILMGCSSGARNTIKQDSEAQNRVYATAYGTGTATGEKKAQVENDHKEYPIYITQYRDTKKTNQPYITSYGGDKETDQTYVTSYGGTKETNRPYVTSYGDDKQTNQPYVTSYGGTKATNDNYIAGYGDNKKTNQPYVTSYGGTKATNDNYITRYGDNKKSNRPYMTSNGATKETKQPYITAYGNAKEDDQHYITGYVNTKADQLTYITGYNNGKGANNHAYITGYNSAKEKNQPYIGRYGDSKEETKCKGHSHAGHNHMMGHENHTQTQPSTTSVDRTEAFKIGFFTPDDLYAGTIMPLYFPVKDYSSRFLPREVAEAIPFSMSQLPNLLQLFSVPQGSPEAKDMEHTLQDCELKPIDGEIKLCATSLDSMVEFARSMIGSQVNFNLLSTTHPTMAADLTQNYTVLEAPKEVPSPKKVFCHPEPYPYAVFFCHFFGTETKVFQVALRGESGDDVEAMAVCHMDTSDWDPDHVLFSLLGVKAGVTSPVCHFLPKNHLVWIPSPTTATA